MAQEIQSIPLGSIKGLHRSVREVMDTLQLPALRFPGDHAIHERALIEIIQTVPLRLVQNKQGEVFCVGHVALFQAALRTLRPESEVACVVETVLDEQVIQRRILTEIFVGRPVLGFHQSDVPAYYVAFCKAIQSGLIAEPKKGAVSHIADLFGVETRRLNSIPVNAEDDSVSGSENPGTPEQDGASPASPGASTERPVEAAGASAPIVVVDEVLPESSLPQKITLLELQKKTRKRPISGVTVDRNGRSIGLFVPLAAEPTREQVAAYRRQVAETEESLVLINNVFPKDLLDRVPLEPFDV